MQLNEYSVFQWRSKAVERTFLLINGNRKTRNTQKRMFNRRRVTKLSEPLDIHDIKSGYLIVVKRTPGKTQGFISKVEQ